MSTVAEIEVAIRALPPAEREQLADHLPAILPELNGDVPWQRILKDSRPRPALTASGDEITAQSKANPTAFSKMRDADSGKKSRNLSAQRSSGMPADCCRRGSKPPPVPRIRSFS